MRQVVVDTSALACYRFREGGRANVAPLVEAILAGTVVATAPDHALLELMHTTRKKANRAGVADRSGFVRRHMEWFMALPIHYTPIEYLENQRALRLLINRGLGSYDALFVWLARDRRATLCTRDKDLIRYCPADVRTLDLRSTAFTL